MFRLTNVSTVAINEGLVEGIGSSQVDNFTVTGVGVPEPTALPMGFAGLISSSGKRSRQSIRQDE